MNNKEYYRVESGQIQPGDILRVSVKLRDTEIKNNSELIGIPIRYAKIHGLDELKEYRIYRKIKRKRLTTC